MIKVYSKKEARDLGRQARDSIGWLKRNSKNSKIVKAIINSPEYKNSIRIGMYFPVKNEPNIKNAITISIQNGKRILLPKVNKNKMSFFYFYSLSELVESDVFPGVFEPNGEHEMGIDNIETIFVPIVAFDKANNRVGYGKGYYDKYLENFKGNIVGVAYDNQMVDLIRVDKYDIPMDKIITESKA